MPPLFFFKKKIKIGVVHMIRGTTSQFQFKSSPHIKVNKKLNKQ